MKGIFFVVVLVLAAGCGKDHSGSAEITSSSIIVGDLDWKEVESSRDFRLKENAKAVGDVDLPVLGSRCTGFLINDDTVMTNHHCVPSSYYATGVTVTFDHYSGVSKSQMVKYDCSTFIGNNRELDYALLKCEGSPGSHYGHVQLDTSFHNEGLDIYVVQQNCDYYNNSKCDWSKKFSTGEITGVSKEYQHNADTLGGSSGSPVFSASNHKVVGLHHAGYGGNYMGRGLYNFAVPMGNITFSVQQDFPSVAFNESDSSGGGDEPSADDDNDTFETAQVLSEKSGSFKAHISSKEDEDFYKVYIPKGDVIKFNIEFTHSEGDLDLYFYKANQKVLKKSTGIVNSEGVYMRMRGGYYYFKVFGYKGAKNKYKVSYSVK